jgi:hypothetical protein
MFGQNMVHVLKTVVMVNKGGTEQENVSLGFNVLMPWSNMLIHCVGCMRYHHSLLYTLVSVQTDIFLVTLRNFHYHLF